jgi:hypothetical protein
VQLEMRGRADWRAVMTLWHWIVGLFRKRPTDPPDDLQARFDPHERQRVLDSNAADAARAADARVTPNSGGLSF